MKDQKVVTLEHPIKKKSLMGFGGVVIDSVIIRPPVAGDLMGLQFTPEHMTNSMMVVLSRVTCIPIDTLKQMSLKDYSKLSNEFNKMAGF